MKRAMWMLTVAVVVLASFGAALACGDQAKAHPAIAKAGANEGCGKADVAGKPGCTESDCVKGDCTRSDCAKNVALVAKAEGAAAAVPAAAVKPCAGTAEGTGCARKPKAADVAKADAVKPVDLAENAK